MVGEMTLALRPYQWDMVDYIVQHPRSNLFAGMGLGKTVSTLTAIDHLSMIEDIYPVLVLGPLRVVASTWPDEIRHWPHLRHLTCSVVTGTAAQRLAALKAPADIYCMNYDNLVWLDETVGDKWPFKMVVADECSKLKGFRLRQGTKRAQALAKYVHRKTGRYVGLTGTPAGNGLAGLWAILWMVDIGQRLGRTYKSFEDRWFGPTWDGYGIRPFAHSQGEIQDRIKDVCLSLDAKDYFDLAEPVINTIFVDLPPAARKHYDEMESEMFTRLAEDEIEAMSAAAKTMKCLQFSNGAVYTNDKGAWTQVHDEKIQALESVIEEAAGAPVIVAYHFKSDLARLKTAFPKARQLDANPKTIADFNAGAIDVLLAHPASAGHGINLAQGGSILCFFSVNWNLEEHLQIIERIGPTRQAQLGTGKVVFLHYILARNTVDEMVLERLHSKRTVQDILLSAMKRKSK
jgi:SNF2 family DNA or RNA helicase